MASSIPSGWQIGQHTTPQTAVQNYQNNATGKGQKWATRLLQAKRDPIDAAAAQADTWISKLTAVGAPGFRAALARVDKALMAKNIATAGPTNYASGISNKGVPKLTRIANTLYPAIQNAAMSLPPRGGDAENEQRMILMRRAMKAMKGTFKV